MKHPLQKKGRPLQVGKKVASGFRVGPCLVLQGGPNLRHRRGFVDTNLAFGEEPMGLGNLCMSCEEQSDDATQPGTVRERDSVRFGADMTQQDSTLRLKGPRILTECAITSVR